MAKCAACPSLCGCLQEPPLWPGCDLRQKRGCEFDSNEWASCRGIPDSFKLVAALRAFPDIVCSLKKKKRNTLCYLYTRSMGWEQDFAKSLSKSLLSCCSAVKTSKSQHNQDVKTYGMQHRYDTQAFNFFSFLTFSTAAVGGATRSPKPLAAASSCETKDVLSALFAWTRAFARRAVPTSFVWAPQQQMVATWKKLVMKCMIRIRIYPRNLIPPYSWILCKGDAGGYLDPAEPAKKMFDHDVKFVGQALQSCGWPRPTWPQYQICTVEWCQCKHYTTNLLPTKTADNCWVYTLVLIDLSFQRSTTFSFSHFRCSSVE